MGSAELNTRMEFSSLVLVEEEDKSCSLTRMVKTEADFEFWRDAVSRETVRGE